MEKLSKIILTLMAAAAVSSCSDTVDLRPFPEQTYPIYIDVDPDGGDTYFGLSLYDDWSISNGNYTDFFKCTPSSGEGGTSTEVCLTATPSTDLSNTSRTETLRVGYGNSITVTQACPYHANFSNAGGSKTFKYKVNSSARDYWVINNIPNWLTVSPSSGSVNRYYDVTITAKENLTGSARYCTLDFGGNNLYIYQGPDKIEIVEEATKNSYWFNFPIGWSTDDVKELTINSTADWTAEASNRGVSLSNASGRAGTSTLRINLTTYGSHGTVAYVYFKIGDAVIKRIAVTAN